MQSRRFLVRTLVGSGMAAALVVAFPVAAQPERLASTLATPVGDRTLILPTAADNSPVISLGSAIDPATGKKVEGIAFVHYKRGFHHQPNRAGGPGGGTDTSSCYAHLARGARWKVTEPWVMNAANSEGLDPDALFTNQAANLQKWEDSADFNVFGAGSPTSGLLSADTAAPDGSNEVYFGSVDSPGAIAVTIVWGVFSGPPSQRQLVEWDQVYDETDFDWSAAAAGEAGMMDFENISTHEVGHAAGMGHPSDSCTEETMYRFAADGEIYKRTLNAGDISGIAVLY